MNWESFYILIVRCKEKHFRQFKLWSSEKRNKTNPPHHTTPLSHLGGRIWADFSIVIWQLYTVDLWALQKPERVISAMEDTTNSSVQVKFVQHHHCLFILDKASCSLPAPCRLIILHVLKTDKLLSSHLVLICTTYLLFAVFWELWMELGLRIKYQAKQ